MVSIFLTFLVSYLETNDFFFSLASDAKDSEAGKLHIKIRIPRVPAIGDKFSSRHGQKGVCSQKYPAVDMPFSESGMQPDIIINPHAFPSRMTIGMFVESLAAKAGAMHGLAQDGTPFCYSEDDTPADFFGEQLLAAGYNYHGNEPMYSGITGKEFAADIYIGVVYYQRLRHMVGDKWQVRTTGPLDQMTRQPVKVNFSSSSKLLRVSHWMLTSHFITIRDVNEEEEFDSEKWNETLY